MGLFPIVLLHCERNFIESFELPEDINQQTAEFSCFCRRMCTRPTGGGPAGVLKIISVTKYEKITKTVSNEHL